MNVQQYCRSYYAVGKLTTQNMEVRKTQFLTEIVLSLFILTITVNKPISAEFSVGAIAMIHSFNVARAIEAYQDAKTQTELGKYE